jgi:phage/plasmid primase-like uncharacterized protein
VLDGPGVFVYAEGKLKSGYCSCAFSVWAASPARAVETREDIFRIIGDRHIREEMFVLDWHFANNRGTLSSSSFEESSARSCTMRHIRISASRLPSS